MDAGKIFSTLAALGGAIVVGIAVWYMPLGIDPIVHSILVFAIMLVVLGFLLAEIYSKPYGPHR